jgi:mannose-6-phosphate isomerase
MTTAQIYKLAGVVQPYAWGGYEYIPRLLNQENKEGKPYAEYWLGAHPNHPGIVLRGTEKERLDTLIAKDATGTLGASVNKAFGSLPYLLKVLDVRQMLSIQVHPSKVEAEKGFKRENEEGIPLTAAHRNYKDENHKPELMVALSPFWLLHGFKTEDKIVQVLEQTPELNSLVAVFKEGGYKGLYEKVMTMPQEEVNAVLGPLAKRVLPLYEASQLSKAAEDFWAARAIATFCKNDNYDRGIFSIYLFNILELKEGEGVFQPAGMPHAYLEGQNVEIMANSDNVLRAGLTDKHIDVAELLKHTDFTATLPQVIQPEGKETFYKAPVPEFGIYQYRLDKGDIKRAKAQSAEIYLLLDGGVELKEGESHITLAQGEAAIVFAGAEVELLATEKAVIYRATAGSV